MTIKTWFVALACAAAVAHAQTSSSVGGGASTSQPAIDSNQAQQPGIGVNSGASNNGSIRTR